MICSPGQPPNQAPAGIFNPVLLEPQASYLNLKIRERSQADETLISFGGCFSNLSVQGLITETHFTESSPANLDIYEDIERPQLDTEEIVRAAGYPHCALFFEEVFDYWLETTKLYQQFYYELFITPLFGDPSS